MKKHDLKEIVQRFLSGEKFKQKSYNDGYELVLIIEPITRKASWWFRGKGCNRGIKFKLASLEDAGYELASAIRIHVQQELNRGVHHSVALETYEKSITANTVREGFKAQYETRLKPYLRSHRQKKGHFENHVEPIIGDMLLDDVRMPHIDALMLTLESDNVRGVVLTLIRKLFEFSYQNELIEKNRFRDLPRTAYGIKKSRGGKALAPYEIHRFFEACEKHDISRIDLLAMALYLTLTVRKCELTEALWKEFNLEARVWDLPKERAKEDHSIAIPLPDEVVNWLLELRSYNPKSEYLFPSRRRSGSPTINESTLNKIMKPVFDEMNINVHGTRHSAYVLMEMSGIPYDIREVCLNHRNDRTYGHSMFFEERKTAHQKLANLISPHVPPCPFI